jgi:hypothetical protein
MTIFDSVRRAHRPVQGLAAAISICVAMIACSGSDHPPAAGSSGSSGGLLDGSGDPDGGSNDGALTDGRRPLDDGGSGDGAIDAAACQALPFVGAFIDEQGVADVAPAATGGAITPGTYDLEALSLYDPALAAAGPTGRVAQSTLAVTANRLNMSENRAMRLPGGATSAPMQTASAYSYMLKNQNLYTSKLCPMPGDETVIPFTATADTLLIFPDATHSLAYRIRP